MAANAGWVSVGVDHDTADFRCPDDPSLVARGRPHSLSRRARSLVITADGGGSNGSRVRLWKLELQRFADELGLSDRGSPLPPGTSKWNKIEHRLFSFITQNWRGRPLTDRVTIVELIGATTTRTGLKVECALDTIYEKGIKVTDAEMKRSTSAATLSILNGTTWLFLGSKIRSVFIVARVLSFVSHALRRYRSNQNVTRTKMESPL